MNAFSPIPGPARARTRRSLRILSLAVALTAVAMLAGTGIAAVGGGRIVYEGYDAATETSDLYTMNADGSEIRRLTEDGAAKGHPEFSPDGTEVSFESVGYESGSCCSRNIYAIGADGSDRRQLTETSDVSVGENFDASWAPDGEWLVFVSNRGEAGGFAGDREIYRMNADGGDETPLTATDARTSDQAPAISPDGTTIAFASDRANSGSDDLFDVYTMDADGSDVTRLTFDGAYAYPSRSGARRRRGRRTGAGSRSRAPATETPRSGPWTPTGPISSTSPTIPRPTRGPPGPRTEPSSRSRASAPARRTYGRSRRRPPALRCGRRSHRRRRRRQPHLAT